MNNLPKRHALLARYAAQCRPVVIGRHDAIGAGIDDPGEEAHRQVQRTAAQIAHLTGDRSRDLPPELRAAG